MLKKGSLRKIGLALFCLLILLVLYLFPKSSHNYVSFKTSYNVSDEVNTIYLINDANYVVRVPISLNGKDFLEKAREMIDYLTVGGKYQNILPNGFRAIIPLNTKILGTDYQDGNYKINFSKDFYEVSDEDEMKLIEALIYSLTSLKEIKSITILVDDVILNRLKSSEEFLPNPLDRSFGINKEYNISSIKNTNKTTMFYLSKYDGHYYYVPVTKVSNDQKDKIEIIIKELSSSNACDTNLISYLNSDTTLKNYEYLDKKLNIDFNNAILSQITEDNILEEVTYAINLSLKENYDVESVVYTVNNKEIASFDIKNLE